MITSVGTLSYSTAGPHRLVVDVDPGLVGLYRALVPPYVRPARQKWPAHITVVRNEPIARPERWLAYQGEAVTFEFDPVVVSDETYLWLNVRCPHLSGIREELGLSPLSAMSRPPDGSDFFHVTLGNFKGT